MIYLDHNATTPLLPRALEAMLPFLKGAYGNPSSFYALARSARSALSTARANVASCIGADPGEIIFTSGGTESDNLALRGAGYALRSRGKHIVVSAVEHQAVINTCEDLQQMGFSVSSVPVDGSGAVNPESVLQAITPETVLISVMYANNETGVIQPVADIGKIARGRGIVFHCDAVQALGKIPVDVTAIGADLVSLSAHKIYGPKGAGALYVRKGTPLHPHLTGGHHEAGLRAGTENVAGCVGFAEAAVAAVEDLESEARRLAVLRDKLESGLREAVPDIRINGAGAERISNTSNISFLYVEAESMLLHLDLKGICASAGSACSTGASEPSHVLKAMGIFARDAQGALRFSLGRQNTEEEIIETIPTIADIVAGLRSVSSVKAV